MKKKLLLLYVLISIYFVILLIGAKIEIDKLKNQVNELRQENIDYKWQLEQIEWICKTRE